jgi:chromosome segregation ATPase
MAKYQKNKDDLDRDVQNLDKTKADLAKTEQEIAVMSPKIEELKASIDSKNNLIMEAGGPEYKKIKIEYDTITK